MFFKFIIKNMQKPCCSLYQFIHTMRHEEGLVLIPHLANIIWHRVSKHTHKLKSLCTVTLKSTSEYELQMLVHSKSQKKKGLHLRKQFVNLSCLSQTRHLVWSRGISKHAIGKLPKYWGKTLALLTFSNQLELITFWQTRINKYMEQTWKWARECDMEICQWIGTAANLVSNLWVVQFEEETQFLKISQEILFSKYWYECEVTVNSVMCADNKYAT